MSTIHLTEEDKKRLYGRTNAQQLENMLNSGRVKFSFIKKTDGTYREAYGTRDLTDPEVDFENVPMGIKTPPSYVITFFDLDKRDWRCCYRSQIVWIDDYIEIPD